MCGHASPLNCQTSTVIPWRVNWPLSQTHRTTDWLERELAHRFDVACCATQEQFRRETRAITRAGQIKDPSGRHEKDDRHRIDDRSRYVLGWSNSAKIAALEAKRRQLEAQLGKVASEIAIIQKQRDELTSRIDALTRLEEFTAFDEQDWASVAAEIAQLVDERNRLESASDVLKQLNENLRTMQKAQRETGEELKTAREKRAKVEQRRSDAQDLRQQTMERLRTYCPRRCSVGKARSYARRGVGGTPTHD